MTSEAQVDAETSTATAPRARRLTPGLRIVATRWILVVAIIYAVLFQGDSLAPLWPNQLFAGALLVYNGLVTWLLGEGHGGKNLKMGSTVADIAAVSLAILISGSASSDFFLVFFAVIILAAISHRLSVVALVAAVACLTYTGLLYAEVGSALWRSSSLLIRVPFIFGVAIFFATVAQESTKGQARAAMFQSEAERLAGETEAMASELGFLRSLTEIGRLALTGSYPGPVVYEIILRLQEALNVRRCSLVVFERDGTRGYLAASGDDPSIGARVFPLDRYPELHAAFMSRDITEVRPGAPGGLWEKVAKHLPEGSPFRSFLIIPLLWGETVLGVFFVRDTDSDRVFTERDREFCSTASMMVSGFIRQNELLEKLRRQSREDAQTGLLNRRAFREEAQRALSTANAETDQLSFFTAGMDNFREFNEKVGDATGNQLISAVGALIEGALPAGSVLARSGSEEFSAMVPATRAVTVEAMQRLLDDLSEELGSLPQTIGVSVGVAVYPWDGEKPESLMNAAHQAMFLAKSAGGHQVCVYEPGVAEERGEEVVAGPEAAQGSAQETGAAAPEEPLPQPAAPQLAGLQAALLESEDLENALSEWACDIEAKNPYGKDHSIGVAQLAVLLARAMGMSDKEATAVKLAALAHDLGRSTIPDEILNKSGKYTDAERQLLEEAPAKAADMLEGVAALAPVRDFVRYHQERWDGSGHPNHLEGDQIPLGAQIVGICDVFQTLTSPRSYRPAMDEEQARDIILRGADKVWNPELANTFVAQVVAPTTMAAASNQEST
jgi:diguanylate cyclase (GGDEF)-like protein